jgi:hypothetical protein
MAKEKKKRSSRVLSDEQKEKLAALREQAREIREAGSFGAAYRSLRKGSVLIGKNKEMSEEKKKQALNELCEDVLEMLAEQ